MAKSKKRKEKRRKKRQTREQRTFIGAAPEVDLSSEPLQLNGGTPPSLLQLQSSTLLLPPPAGSQSENAPDPEPDQQAQHELHHEIGSVQPSESTAGSESSPTVLASVLEAEPQRPLCVKGPDDEEEAALPSLPLPTKDAAPRPTLERLAPVFAVLRRGGNYCVRAAALLRTALSRGWAQTRSEARTIAADLKSARVALVDELTFLRGNKVERRELVRELARRVGVRILQLCLLVFVGLVIAGTTLFDYELETSSLQSRFFHTLARKATFAMQDGPSSLIRFPTGGPQDLRAGYTLIPEFIDQLTKAGFVIKSQAELSPTHASLIDHGIFAQYETKLQTGLELVDRTGEPVLISRFPEAYYTDFESIPPFIVNTLLFIEDRHLLEPSKPFRNPAVDWNRFAKAVIDVLRSKVNPEHDVHGGSTLATQIEKFKHSNEGITGGPKEKLRQMFSAAVRSYRDGRANIDSRRGIVRDYINSVPLAALPGYGEINGLGDGLWAYFGADLSEVNRLLHSEVDPENEEQLRAQGAAYRQVLSLFLAHRRPSDYLLQDPEPLERQVRKFLPALYSDGVIPEPLYQAALKAETPVRRVLPKTPRLSYLGRKGTNLVRTHLLQLLGLERLYDLDRIDLTAYSTLDHQAQTAVAAVLNRLRDAEYVKSLNLTGERLLERHGDLGKVIYSFTLYEHDGGVNKLRVQTDNFDQPFNINEGVKLDLGSTAKLRTLISYLGVIEELYYEVKALEDKKARAEWTENNPTALARWVNEYLQANRNASLEDILRAAMERRYSANPGEAFFTAGGIHTFENFNKQDNGKVPTVRESLQRSINLPFIRMMRDIVSHYMLHTTGSTARTLDKMEEMTRQEYLSRFADKEGRVFLSRFYRKYAGKSPREILNAMLDGVERKPRRFAALFWVLHPDSDFSRFAQFMRESFEDKDFDEVELRKYYDSYANKNFTLGDKAYIARVHPLELWIAAFLLNNPGSDFSKAVEASAATRQEVYSWLFSKKRRKAQDTRIRMMLEAEAFSEIHRRWQRLGYPLNSLVPSLATALGTSADRPDALAQLMGILVNEGKRLPYIRVNRLEFAMQTPYATVMENAMSESEQVLSPELARVVREALVEVVEQGTAIRLKGGFKIGDRHFPIGGKTGTGDHRHEVYGRGGRLKESRVVNRTATFVFLLGDRYFGTITAIVRGKEAENFKFTSALPVQLLKLLQPALEPLLIRGEEAKAANPPSAEGKTRS